MTREKKHGKVKGDDKKHGKYAVTDGNNRMSVHLSKGYFVEGERVTGQLMLDIASATSVGALKIKVQGYETAEWEETRRRQVPGSDPPSFEDYTVEHEGDRDFFKNNLVVASVAGLQPGHYEFPFEFQLPTNLTGTYLEKRKIPGWRSQFKAKVQYKIKAKCSMNGQLKAKQKLIIHEAPGKIVEQKYIEHEGTVLLCCCIPRGKVRMAAKFDRDAYVPGDTANIIVDCDNLSQSNIDHLTMKLNKILTLVDDHGGRFQQHTVVAERNYDGVAPGQSTKQRLCPLTIPNDATTTTDGKNVKCSYRLDVEAQVPWAPDIEIQIPVTIFFPQLN